MEQYKIANKSQSILMKCIYYGLLMFLWCPQFMTSYATTIRRTIYAPGGRLSYPALMHELQHVRDAIKYPIIYELSYLFLLPAVFTMRSFWELRAYRETIKALNSYDMIYDIEYYVDQFCSSNYLWMCPFRSYIRSKLND